MRIYGEKKEPQRRRRGVRTTIIYGCSARIKLICMEFEFLFAFLSNARRIFYTYIFFLPHFPLLVIENYFPYTFPPATALFSPPPSSPCPKFQKYHRRPDRKPIKHIIILYSSVPMIIIIIMIIL